MKINNAVFIHIPKTGGISIGRLFEPKYRGDHRIFSEEQLKNSFAFTFVRHPIDRFISGFENQKRLVESNINLGIHLRKRMKDLNFNFEEFVLSLSPNDIKRNLHFKPQHLWINSGINFVGKLENFTDDLKRLFELIDVDEKILENLQKINISERKDMKDYLKSKDVIEKLYNLYKKDFDILNYQKMPI